MGAVKDPPIDLVWHDLVRDLLGRPKGTLLDGVPVARLLRLAARQAERCPECERPIGLDGSIGCVWCQTIEACRR